MLVSESGGIDVDVLLLGVVKDFAPPDFKHVFLCLLLDALQNVSSPLLPVLDEQEDIDGVALGKGGEIDLLLFLLGWHSR